MYDAQRAFILALVLILTAEGIYFIASGAPTGASVSCINMCGNGECDEIVCQAAGCPCPETSESCPEDCAKGINEIYARGLAAEYVSNSNEYTEYNGHNLSQEGFSKSIDESGNAVYEFIYVFATDSDKLSEDVAGFEMNITVTAGEINSVIVSQVSEEQEEMHDNETKEQNLTENITENITEEIQINETANETMTDNATVEQNITDNITENITQETDLNETLNETTTENQTVIANETLEQNTTANITTNLTQNITDGVAENVTEEIEANETAAETGFCGYSTFADCTSDSQCIQGGCSGQVCQSFLEDPIFTTCEWRDCYNPDLFGVECSCHQGMCQWTS